MLTWERIRLQCRRPWFDPWVGKIPWRRERLPTPIFWSGEFHGLYRPWGHKESDTTERLSLFTFTDLGSSFSLSFLPFHTVHGVLKARILKWLAIPFSSRPCLVRTLHHDLSIWVAIRGMAHCFIDLDKAVVHGISLIELKKVGKNTIPFRYDLNQIPYIIQWK